MNATASTSAPVVPLSAPPAERAGPRPVQNHETWAKGDAAHQGDLILICLGSILPGSCKPRQNRQLAEGETRGSKHVVAGGEVFSADADQIARLIAEATGGKVNAQARYIGPVFTGPCVLEHPEHQHQAFPADTVTAVVFQRSQTAEEREVRAQD